MTILSTNKTQGVLKTVHRKAGGKTEDISWIFTVHYGAHYEQKVPTENPIPYCTHAIRIYYYYHYYHHHHHHNHHYCDIFANYTNKS